MNRILYLGLEVPSKFSNNIVFHCPLIQIVKRPIDDPEITKAFKEFSKYTHLIFTSKSAVTIFFEYAPFFNVDLKLLQTKFFLAVGSATAKKIQSYGDFKIQTAKQETAEGIIELLSLLVPPLNSRFFWPHAAKSRPLLEKWMKEHFFNYQAPIFYDTISITPSSFPSPDLYDEIIFTSPSIVESFLKLFGKLPKDKILTPIGPVTASQIY